MEVNSLSSSSCGTFDFCPMKWFLVYNLGYRESPHYKATLGSICHKVLETIANKKLTIQNSKRKTFVDKEIGKIHIEKHDVENIIERSYKYYTTVQDTHNKYDESHLKTVKEWVYKALLYNNGEYDPMNLHIIEPEQKFSYVIEKPWSMYETQLLSGEMIDGFLTINGIIDLVTKVDNDTYMVLDWKTGRKYDWNKDRNKTYELLHDDIQLMMYYYVCSKKYPNITNWNICINYINDGGPVVLTFGPEDMDRIENKIRGYFEDIKSVEIPRQNKSWKCKKFCYFGTTTFGDTHIKPLTQRKDGELENVGQYMCKCSQVKYCLENRPIDSVIINMKQEGFEFRKNNKSSESGV